MNIKVNNDADRYALASVASLQNSRSLVAILAEYINAQGDEPTTVTIKRNQLPSSYKSNPSLFALRLLAKCPQFADSSGYSTPMSPEHVTVKLLRDRKPDNARYTQAIPSLKRVIKNWINLNEKKSKKLRIPIEGIPPFFFSHPEQLTYQLRKETQTPIKIIKLNKHWVFARK